MPELLSAQQVADRLSVAEKTVRRWIERGDLHAEKHGHAYAINLAEAEAVFANTLAGKAAARASASMSHRDRELVELRQEVAELRGRYLEAHESLELLRRELVAEQRARIRLELEREGSSIRAA